MTLRPDHEPQIRAAKKRICFGGDFEISVKDSIFSNLNQSIQDGIRQAIESCENQLSNKIYINLEKSDGNDSQNYFSFFASLFIVPLHSTESYHLKVEKDIFSARSSIIISKYFSPYYILYLPNYFFQSADVDLVYEEVAYLIFDIEEQEREYKISNKHAQVSKEKLFKNIYRFCLSEPEECGKSEVILKKISDSKKFDKVDEINKIDLVRLEKVVTEKNDNFMHGCFCRKYPDPELFAKCPVESEFDKVCQIRYECLKINSPDACDNSFLKNLTSLETLFQKEKNNDEYIKSKVSEQLRLLRLKKALK